MKLKRVLAVAQKEWREILRDRIYLLLAFLMAPMLMIVFGYGMSQDIQNIALAIVDEDGSAMSRDYARHYIESRHFAYRGQLPNARELFRWSWRQLCSMLGADTIRIQQYPTPTTKAQ